MTRSDLVAKIVAVATVALATKGGFMASLMRMINEIYRCGSLYRTLRLEDDGLNGLQTAFVLNICSDEGTTQEKLARSLYIHKSTVTRQLASLEEKGFIERRVDESDKRNMLVYPTQKAKDILPKIKLVFKEWREYLTEDLSEEEKESMESILTKLADRAKKYVSKTEADCR